MQSVKRILVVDDDPHVREILVQRLRGRRFEADSAESGAQAIHKIDHDRYDLILLDLVMPGAISGSEVARQLDERDGAPPYIIVSGMASPWHRHHPCQKPVAMVEKPIDFEKLVKLIHDTR